MDHQMKRKLTFATIGLIFLLSGIEYAVILPTVWLYLQTLEAPPYFLGLALSAFSFSGLLSGPLFGHWSDRTRTTKKIILFANLFEILGNFMYFMGFSKWLLLSSRLVAVALVTLPYLLPASCATKESFMVTQQSGKTRALFGICAGVGTGAGSSIFGFLTRSTAPKDRATVFAAVMACRQAGLLIGPAFNIFLRLCDFRLGPFVVNKYTAPGLFMCVLWSLLQLVVIFLYWDLPPQERGQADESGSRGSAESKDRGGRGGEDEHADEGDPLMRSQELVGSYGSFVPPSAQAASDHSSSPSPTPHDPENSPRPGFFSLREFLKEEVVVLLAAQFITLFNQTALETMVTPLTQKFFGYGELENSIMYCLCGVEVIAGFLLVRWLSRRVSERVVLAIGLVICNVSGIWCLIFMAQPLGDFPWKLTEFIIGVFLQVLGLPFVAVAQVSLFSKVTAEKTQGFSQGVRRSVGGLATILGPLWAGGLTENMYIMMGVMMGLLVLLMIMLVFSYNRLVAPATEEDEDNSDNSSVS